MTLEPKQISNRKWLYALVNAGIMMPYAATGAFLIFYYTDVKKLSPVLMGTVTAIYAIYNALNNSVLGHLSDRTRSRWGRRSDMRHPASPCRSLFPSLREARR